jgi:hypothetical protein
LQSGHDQLVGDRVGLGNRFDIVIVVFLFDVKRAFVMLEDGGARRTREFAGETQFLIV